MGSIHSMPICSHINFYSLTLKWHFDLFWPLWPLSGLFCNFFQLLNIHFNVFNKGASSRGTIILAVGISKLWFLGAKNGPLLNTERIVKHTAWLDSWKFVAYMPLISVQHNKTPKRTAFYLLQWQYFQIIVHTDMCPIMLLRTVSPIRRTPWQIFENRGAYACTLIRHLIVGSRYVGKDLSRI